MVEDAIIVALHLAVISLNYIYLAKSILDLVIFLRSRPRTFYYSELSIILLPWGFKTPPVVRNRR